MGLTSKPCPGCEKDRGGRRFRETGKVCDDCRIKLFEHESLCRKIAELEANDTETVEWNFGFAPHILEMPCHGDDLSRGHFLRTWWTYLRAISSPIAASSYEREYRQIEESDERLFSRRLAVWAKALYKASCIAIEGAYRNGVNDGHNCLVRIANGEVGIENYGESAQEDRWPEPDVENYGRICREARMR